MAHPIEKGTIPGPGGNGRLDWAAARFAKSVDGVSGDGYMIRAIEEHLLFAVVDGTGSGQLANASANYCLEALARSTVPDLPQIFRDADQALQGTRGAALGLCLLDLAMRCLRWAAVGDVDGLLCPQSPDRKPFGMFQNNGTLGRLAGKTIHETRCRILPGDLVCMTTDGVSRTYRRGLDAMISPTSAAARILDRFGNPSDDSTVFSFRVEQAL